MSKECVTNPIPASQIQDVNINWDCLTVPTCTTLELSLQVLVDAICVINDLEDIDVNCLDIEEKTISNILQSLIDKACESESTTDNTEEIEELDLSSLNLCTPDNWDCDSNNSCITVDNPCGPEPTNEEILQALVSRVVKQGELIKELCEKIEEKDTEIAEIKLELEDGCCDNNNLQGQINTINTTLNTINQNCC